MSLLQKYINDPIDRWFAERAGDYQKARVALEKEEYWAAACRNIAPVTIEEHKSGRYILINKDTMARCVIVGIPYESENGYPEGLRDTFISRLIGLSTHGKMLSYSLILEPISTKEAKSMIQQTMYVNEFNATQSVKENIKSNMVSMRDMEFVLSHEHSTSSFRNVAENKHKLFHSSFFITMWAHSEKELNATESDIITIMESEQVKYEFPDYYHKETFLAAQPYNMDTDFARVQLLTPYAAVLASTRNPNSMTDQTGIWFGIDRITKKNIIIDVEKLVAPHMIGVGATGSGKTASTFAYLMRLLDVNQRVIYLTPKADEGTNHRALVSYYGDNASLVDIGPRGHNINPLQIIYDKAMMHDDVVEYAHAFNTHKEIVIQFLNLWFEGTGSINMSTMLDMALNTVYDNAGIKKDIPSTWHKAKWPVMNDLVNVLEDQLNQGDIDADDKRTIKAILNKTRSLAEGGLLEYLNKPTDTDFSKDLLVIDLSSTPQSIRDAMNVLITGICGQRFRSDNKRRTVICVDEAGVFLRNQKLTEFLLQALTMGRSHRISLWCLTQQPSDLRKANVSEEFFTNMSLKVVLGLNMTADNIGIVADQFKLGEYEKEQLISSQVGEGIFMIGNQKIPLQIKMTDLELDIIKGKFLDQENHVTAHDSEMSILPELKDFVLEHNICLEDWVDHFNLSGWRREQMHKIIDGSGFCNVWINEDIIGQDGKIFNQTLDHYVTVMQIAAYIIRKGGSNVKVTHYKDADITFTYNDLSFAFEYEREGSHTIQQLQEKKNLHMKNYDYVFFICNQRYKTKLEKAIGQESVITRGQQLQNFIDSIIG